MIITGTLFPMDWSTTPFKVLFGTVEATKIISKSSTQIVVESPAGTSGTVQVKVKVNGA